MLFKCKVLLILAVLLITLMFSSMTVAKAESTPIDISDKVETKSDNIVIELNETDKHAVYVHADMDQTRDVTSKISFEKDVTISTLGDNSYGVHGYFVENRFNGGSNTITFNGKATINTSGATSYGAAAAAFIDRNNSSKSSTEIIFNGDTTINTSGKNSIGAHISATYDNISKITFGSSAIITTAGDSAYGIYMDSEHDGIPEVAFKDTATIMTTGDKAHGIYYNGGNVLFYDNPNVYTTITVSGAGANVFHFAKLAPSYNPIYNNVIATSEKANLIENRSNSNLTITFTGKSYLYGDLRPYSQGSTITMKLEDETIWEGGSFGNNSNNNNSRIININMTEGTTWTVNKNSIVNMLNLGGGKLLFKTNTDSFITTTVSDLRGEGKVVMNVNLDPNNGGPKGDFLKTTNASGDYSLNIIHTNVGGAEELVLVEVAEPLDGLTFTLSSEKVQIGSYFYTLGSRGIENSQLAKEWFLKLQRLDDKIKEEASDPVIGFGEFAKSIDVTLSDEFLRPRNMLWFTSFYKLQKFDKAVLNTSLKQQVAGGIVGLDKAISDNLSVGQFFGLGIAYQNIGEGSIGHIASLTTGVYANYTIGGFLASGYVRVANYIHDLKLKGSMGFSQGTLNTYGWSASMQISQRLNIPGLGLYITPKAKATYTYVKEQSYSIGGMPIQNLDITGFVTWLGARVGIEKNNAYEKPYGYYLEAGWIHDTNPSVTVIVTDEEDETTTIFLGKNRFEVGLGFYTSPLGVSSFSAEFKYAKGQGIEEPIKINVGGSIYF